jgi:hypothetical protein
MHFQVANRSFAISCVHWLRLTLHCIVLSIVAVQIAVPPRLAAADLASTFQNCEEDGEPAEESESDGEEVLFEFRHAQELRQSRSEFNQQLLEKRTSSNAHCRRPTPPANGDRANRNGIGGPLRC